MESVNAYFGSARRRALRSKPASLTKPIAARVTIGNPRHQRRMDAAADHPDPASGSRQRNGLTMCFLSRDVRSKQARRGTTRNNAGCEASSSVKSRQTYQLMVPICPWPAKPALS